MKVRHRLALIVLYLLPVSLKAQLPVKGFEQLFQPPRSYRVSYAKVPPVIDGNINDAIWQDAQWSEDFCDIEDNLVNKLALKTNVKMLWGDSCLYIAAKVMDPHVWAYVKKHDQVVFFDNDFEVFIDPNGTGRQYFELEFNARNTVFDLFMDKPYRNNGSALFGWNPQGLKSAVMVQGTLNSAKDTDQSWTIEIAIPYRAISIGNDIQKPSNGTLWRINFSRVEWDTKVVNGNYVKLKNDKGRNLPEHNWVWSPQGVINMHYPERWGYLQFVDTGAKLPAFTAPYGDEQKKYLWLIYYKQKKWSDDHHIFNPDLKSLGLTEEADVLSQTNTLKLEATAHQFIAFITDGKEGWSINQDGLVERSR